MFAAEHGVRAAGSAEDAVRGADVVIGSRYVPGGRIEPGESPEAAVAREMREETGLSVDVRRKLIEVAVARLQAGQSDVIAANADGPIRHVFLPPSGIARLSSSLP